MSRKDEWTPYGLEAIRQAHLKRRRILGALAALGVLALALLAVETTSTTRLSISANGNEVTDSVSIPEPDKPKGQDYVTIALEPGKVSRVESGNDPTPPQVERAAAPQAVRASPYPWKLWALQALPWLLAGLVAYLLAARRGKHDEINYGVYKGAMPLEMVTAHHERLVFTKRWARSSVFGKRRGDYLPPEVQTEEG
ncbi:MAG TPA: hypothetical protein VNX21_06365 [Candidatus Thermoplasmatota archaeon]|nr:hypothetical protein [Candidatus Thermoplasmatota archaeon]